LRFSIFLCLLFAACGSDPAPPTIPVATDTVATPIIVPPTVSSSFEANGIGFDVPNGWAMTDTIEAGGGYYVACERIGENQSGMVAITRVDDPKLKLEKIMEQRIPKGTLVEKGFFNGNKGFVAMVTNEDSGVKMTKNLYVFQACDAKYVFSTLSETQNQVQNQADFQAIIQSWKCR
jgi:hypothetical protein